jgi:hypothetical protein
LGRALRIACRVLAIVSVAVAVGMPLLRRAEPRSFTVEQRPPMDLASDAHGRITMEQVLRDGG